MASVSVTRAPVVVNLAPYCNGDAISASDEFDGASIGYLSGGVNCAFPADELPGSYQVVTLAGTPFRFPSKQPKAMNTVEPEGQHVQVPPGEYRRLHVLGYTIGTGYREPVKLIGPNKETTAMFGLSSLYSAKPEFGERLALRTSGVVTYRKGLVAPRPLSIWSYTLTFDQPSLLTAVRLPVNPNMRIFALTLA